MPEVTSCPNCTSTDLLVVNLAPNGTTMRFHTCRHCESRWWEDVQEGSDIPLDDVIAQIAT